MEREQLLNRIQNLLNKTVANGATEAEAEAAMVAAQRLMDGHNIALAEVLASDADAVSFDQEVAWEGRSLDGFYDAARPIVEQVFAVKAMVLRNSYTLHGLYGGRTTQRTRNVQVILFGDPTNLDGAKWALKFLASTFRRLWDSYRLRTGLQDRYAYRGYLSGLADGFLSKLAEDRADPEREQTESGKNALVLLSTRLDRAFEGFTANFEDGRSSRVGFDPEAYDDGCRDGREINLARPIEKADPRKLGAK